MWRQYHACTQNEDEICIVHGGMNENFQECGELFYFNMTTKQWHLYPHFSPKISQHSIVEHAKNLYLIHFKEMTIISKEETSSCKLPFDIQGGHKACLYNKQQEMVLFGQYCYSKAILARYTFATQEWILESNTLPVLSHFAMTIVQDRYLLIIGGHDYASRSTTERVILYDLQDKTWQYVQSLPFPLQEHSLVTYQDKYLYVFGGKKQGPLEVSNSLLRCEMQMPFKWEIIPSNVVLPSLRSHCAMIYKDEMVLFGCNHLLCYHIPSNTWQALQGPTSLQAIPTLQVDIFVNGSTLEWLWNNPSKSNIAVQCGTNLFHLQSQVLQLFGISQTYFEEADMEHVLRLMYGCHVTCTSKKKLKEWVDLANKYQVTQVLMILEQKLKHLSLAPRILEEAEPAAKKPKQ